ncbi:MAG TPA: ABC transporter permease [Acidobacteriaceae bacterium]
MSLASRIANLFRRSHVDREIDDELRAHIEMRTEDNIRTGMEPEAARRDALVRFGNRSVMRERANDAETEPVLAGIGRDLHYALRQLRHAPGFALTAILTLALGIGANVVVLSVLNALVLKPLDLPHADRLYLVEHKEHNWYSQSYPDYVDYRDRNTSFSGMVAYDMAEAALSTGGWATRNFGYLASGNYFDVLGIQPMLGRFFHAADEHGENSAPYIVLSYELWRRRFGGNPRVVGTTVDLNQRPFTVIGVAPQQFHGTETFYWPDFWIPIVEDGQIGYSHNYLNNRSTHNLLVLGRVKPGVTLQQAEENLNAISSQLAQQYPLADNGLNARLIKPGWMGDFYGDSLRSFMTALTALAALVLLAACANLGSIFAARAADRGRELAIRLAIGSSRWHILRQLLTEAVVVSLAGGVVGTAFATPLLQALSRWQPFHDFPVHVTVTANAAVYASALLLSIGSGVFFGLLPARQVWRTDAVRAIRGRATESALFRRLTMRDLLLGVQIALCTLLVTASLVALRGMQRSLHAPLGFQPSGVVLAATQLTMAGYREDQFVPVQNRMLEEVRHIPGVTGAGIIDRVMLGQGCCGSESVFPRGTTDFRKELFDARNFSISPGYLEASGTRLLSGRDFTAQDTATSPQVVLVNPTFARIMFGDKPPVGQQFLLFRGTQPKQVVGVVEDGKYQSLTEEPQPAMFFPMTQEINNYYTVFAVRSDRPAAEIAAALDRTLTSIDPRLPLSIRPWSVALDMALFPARAAAAALGVMGLLAAMLAVTGTFGMAAYSVSKRMRELGLRVALGARRVELMRSALGRPLLLLISGSVVGLAAGVVASRLLAQIVYEATPRDPLVLVGVLATMAFIGLVATWAPARHALSIDPARLLREE